MAVSTWARRGGTPRYPRQLSTMVDERQHDDLAAFAAEENRSLSEVAREALAVGLPIMRRRARGRRGEMALDAGGTAA